MEKTASPSLRPVWSSPQSKRKAVQHALHFLWLHHKYSRCSLNCKDLILLDCIQLICFQRLLLVLFLMPRQDLIKQPKRQSGCHSGGETQTNTSHRDFSQPGRLTCVCVCGQSAFCRHISHHLKQQNNMSVLSSLYVTGIYSVCHQQQNEKDRAVC